jgi:predicted SpoU family rRNA methylase
MCARIFKNEVVIIRNKTVIVDIRKVIVSFGGSFKIEQQTQNTQTSSPLG